MKNKILFGITVIAIEFFIAGLFMLKLPGTYIPFIMCLVSGAWIVFFLFLNYEYLERHFFRDYKKGGYIETEEPPELVIPIDEAERFFTNYSFQKHPKYRCSIYPVKEVEVDKNEKPE